MIIKIKDSLGEVLFLVQFFFILYFENNFYIKTSFQFSGNPVIVINLLLFISSLLCLLLYCNYVLFLSLIMLLTRKKRWLIFVEN
jgi:hypothetical protein